MPMARPIPKTLTIHGDERVDPYYWLNDRKDPKVIDYLKEENKYFKAQMKHTEPFQENLFKEMKGRIKQDDAAVPYKENGYWYITKYKKGLEYPIYTRKKETLEAKEEVIFDENEMAKGFSYHQLNDISISPNNRLASFGVDTLSRRIYTIGFKNLETGEIMPDKIENTTGDAVWAKDNRTVFYTRKDEALRSYKIYKHILGEDPAKDALVFHEKDDTFSCFVYKTKSRAYIVIGTYSTLSQEYRFIPADQPNADWKVFQKRERKLEYSIDHFENTFYVVTNKDEATNFKIMKTDLDKTEKEHWEDFIPHRKDVLLEDIEIFKNYFVITERTNGLLKIQIMPWQKGAKPYYIDFDEETYQAGLGFNPDFESKRIRYYYSSMTTPKATIDFDMENQTKEIKKQMEVLGGKFDKSNYISKRLWATARDGKKVAVSLVHHKNTKISKDTPLLLYSYGSYGYTIPAYFSSARLSLLDRGFVFAVAHIRGGQYLGRAWYEDGKLLKKKNTFFDFIDTAKYLISQGYSSSSHLYAMGGSAGGLLMGVVINEAPDLFNGVIAAVPFVDVVTTMLDDSIPLTTGEYDEWGNPNDKVYYDYMKSYSPYDNVSNVSYPNLLVTTGLHDSQVQYWEPAKWVAKLRTKKTGENKLFLYTNMETGHGGASGRFEYLKEVAMEYAFLLDLEGIRE